jgi:hypothetical protein
MPSTFPCATCGTLLNNNTFAYQKHMTNCHWPGKNNSFPLASIFTSSTPVSSIAQPAFVWPSLQPINSTASDHYSPLYTNAAWIEKHSNTSADPFYTSSPRNTWPPRSLSLSSESEISPCERVCAAATSSVLGKRKRSGSDGGLRIDSPLDASMSGNSTGMSTPSSPSITPQVADFLASIGVAPSQIGQQRVYFTLTRPSAP